VSAAVAERKKLLLRLDPKVHAALKHWADDEFRSVNAQIEFLLRKTLQNAGRLPSKEPSGPTGDTD